ncbi:HNH endonuclease, partial [Escherichia coli]|nr:HNH endonuclease [Escherichia coli]
MERVKSIVYRHLTNADFFNINKPPGMELGGGGQAYIDFPTSSVTPAQWHEFFTGINGVSVQQETQGPSWTFPIYSLTLDNGQNPAVQSLKIYQRRQQSVSITSQKLFSSRSNRVRAWHPQSGFPIPVDNTDRSQCPDGLMVYLAATYEGKVWAGWFLNDGTTQLPLKGIPPQSINSMFSLPADAEGYSGIINFHSNDYLYLNPLDKYYPLQSQGTETYTSGVYNPANDESTFIDDLFNNDN